MYDIEKANKLSFAMQLATSLGNIKAQKEIAKDMKIMREETIKSLGIKDKIIEVPELEEVKEATKAKRGRKPKEKVSTEDSLLPIVKQFHEDEMIAIEPLYASVGEVDGHGDFIETIEDMRVFVDAINKANEAGVLQSSLFHTHKTNAFKMMRAWVNECECSINGQTIKKGMPLAEIQFTNNKAWELRKSGKFMGLSIGARAIVTEVEDET